MARSDAALKAVYDDSIIPTSQLDKVMDGTLESIQAVRLQAGATPASLAPRLAEKGLPAAPEGPFLCSDTVTAGRCSHR